MTAAPHALGTPWAGKSPSDWSLRRLKDIAKVVNGYPFDSKLFDAAGEHELVRIRDLNSTSTETRYNGEWVEAAAVQTGDVLVGMDGDFNVGVWKGARALLNQRVCCVRGETPLLTKFLAYVLPAPLSVTNDLTYFTTVKHLSSLDVERFTLYVPPPEVLEQTVNFLDEQTARIDALIAEKELLLDSLRDAIEGYAFHLVTEGLEGRGRSSKRDEGWLRRLPSHWSTPKLGYFAEIGNGSTPRREMEKYWVEGTVRWVTSTAINDRVIRDTAERVTECAVAETGLRMVRPGSAIVGLIGQGPTRGMTARLAVPATVSQNVAYVTSRDTSVVGDDYLVVVLTGLYTALRYLSDGSGGAQGAMNCDTLRAFRVPIAPPKEQGGIVDAFTTEKQAIENLQAHVHEHLERLREYRASLISAAVTGQLDVGAPVAAPEQELVA